jgi:nitrogen regulatory protein PII
VNFVPKVKLEIAVSDSAWPNRSSRRCRPTSSRTGKIGDGKIFVLDLEKAVRVRTGESGDDAHL